MIKLFYMLIYRHHKFLFLAISLIVVKQSFSELNEGASTLLSTTQPDAHRPSDELPMASFMKILSTPPPVANEESGNEEKEALPKKSIFLPLAIEPEPKEKSLSQETTLLSSEESTLTPTEAPTAASSTELQEANLAP
jgi:hypothetical protein